MYSWKLKLYREFHAAYKAATCKSHHICDEEVPKLWKQLQKADGSFSSNVREEIKKLRIQESNNRGSLLNFLKRAPGRRSSAVGDPDPLEVVEVIQNSPTLPTPLEASNSVSNSDEPQETTEQSQKFETPAQDKVQTEINILTFDVAHLSSKKEKGLATDDEVHKLKKLRIDLKKKIQDLKNKKKAQERQKRRRDRARQVILSNPDVAEKLKKRKAVGRPALEEDQPDLLKAIIDLATYGAAAEERRRSELVRSVKTLDELTEALSHDFQISRSGVYLRLLPKRSNSTEGKRHVNTVPDRLIRATNDGHKQHADTMFCKTTINYLEEIASFLGPNTSLFLSQDDKARVPIGKTAANKQTPLLMHLDYRIRLPDHDWVIAEKHKLIPSVYGVMTIKNGMIGNPKAVTYSGPTFIAIRSGKHSSSTAYSHAKDFDTLLNTEEFFEYSRSADGGIKPVVIIVVDGGPDENPRYEKVINCAVSHFIKYDLDAIFIATNAPGRSAFNRVERRMAPLSRELAGLILPHNSFGQHLDDQGRTIDADLERQNFEKAGNVLADTWNELVIDGFPTKAVYVKPDESEATNLETRSVEWRSQHVRESHYFLQIVKCSDRTCCNAPRSPYFNFFPRFVPAPLCIDEETLKSTDNSDGSNCFTSFMTRLHLNDAAFKLGNEEVPFDICCPSVQELVVSRTCDLCGEYFASIKNLKQHRTMCRRRRNVNNPTLDSEAAPANLFVSRRHNRPVRESAKRGREKMITWTSRLNDVHCDWVDEEDLGNVEIENTTNEQNNQSDRIPVVTIETVMKSNWQSDD